MHHTLPIAFLDSLGGGELLSIAVVVLLLFGPKRLPEIARMIGKASAHFNRALQDFKDQLMHGEEDEPAAPLDQPGENPLPKEYAEPESKPEERDDRSGPPEGHDRAG